MSTLIDYGRISITWGYNQINNSLSLPDASDYLFSFSGCYLR